MSLIKLWYHILAIIKIFGYKVFFKKNFSWGKGSTFRKMFTLYMGDKAKLTVGKDCFFNHMCSINVLHEVDIGEGCLFGENVKIYDHNHRFSDKTVPIKIQGFSIKPVVIGKHCWFGSNVVILKGVHIGDNCVIGAGSIIAQDIPDNSLVTMGRELVIKPIRKTEAERG